MLKRLIHIDTSLDESLQSQIRNKLVEGILVGSFALGSRLPSSRKLAEQLGVARNTVVLVYQTLQDEGYIVSKERSGIYVSDKIHQGWVNENQSHQAYQPKASDNQHRFKRALQITNQTACPADWNKYAYPFIDGKFDTSLYPVKEWREANQQANVTREINQWSQLQGIGDDPMLVEQIRTKVIPRRGIHASSNEILITVGTQQALHLVSQLFVDDSVTVAVEEPGYPEVRDLMQYCGANLVYQTVDDNGMQVDDRLDQCDIVYTTPSHQTPTSVTMSMTRRHELLEKANAEDLLIIEDDFEFESNFLRQPHPALRSMDDKNRVIYISCISKVLASGIQIGFIVADSGVINELKKLRKMTMRNPPLNNQRAVAYFLSLGYYDAFMWQLHKVFFERWLTLREALNTYLPNCIDTGPIQGGTAYWITGPKQLDGENLREKAAELGILIEPVKRYFAQNKHPENCFRMGITSIPNNRIRAGVSKLAELIHQLTAEHEEKLSNASGKLLCDEALHQLLPGAQLECQMVYGVPCTIDLLPNGKMTGHTGGIDSETDTGRWWIENGMYWRQWKLWSYGEIKGFYVIVDGQQMKWFDQNNCFVRQLELKGYPTSLDQ